MASTRPSMRVLSGQDPSIRNAGVRIPSSAHRDAGNGVTSGYNILSGYLAPDKCVPCSLQAIRMHALMAGS
jgi:hypothetical protein